MHLSSLNVARARCCTIFELFRFVVFALCGLSMVAGVAHAAATAQTQEYTLANGLRVVVKEDHRAPTVISMVWYKAGSMDEFNGTTGVAHMLEHMMFKGTKDVPAGEFSRLIAAAGGTENAFTARDATAYHVQIEKSQLPLVFRLEADRMQNLALSQEEYTKEIQVVMEERRLRTDDQPEALLYEQFMATAFTAHPYRVPTIGWMNDLQNMTYLDARAWYDRWYAPNNALIVVVGDVNAKDVFALAEKNFGAIKMKPLSIRKPQIEPEQHGVRRVVVKAPAELPSLLMGYHVPILHDIENEWEPYALDMLTGVLNGNDAARLNKALVRDQKIAIGVDVDYDSTQRGPGMFTVSGVPNSGRTVAELEQALRAQIALVVQQGVSDQELQRVKAQIVAGQVYQRDSIYFQASQIGGLLNAGYPSDAINVILRKLQQVTPAQVQAVAKKYLIDDSLTVAVLDPQPIDPNKPVPPPQGGRDVR